MRYTIEINDDFDLKKIFECGQCFRWNETETGVWSGVAMGRAARVSFDGRILTIADSAPEGAENVWQEYFDLDRDYRAARQAVAVDGYMAAAGEFGAGIRILNQDRWETLCSFIISQCNNIPRIKKIIETLCRLYGRPFSEIGGEFFSFPNAGTLAGLSPDDLAPLRCGYRAPYIISAARAVSEGRIDLDALSKGDPETALRTLKTLNGVGDKVANCAVLFGLHMLDAFPVDVWMKKAIRNHCGPDFDPSVFSPYAGIAQQYMFFYERSGSGQ
jgi:N-glycosylase/DNA lyase